MPKTAQPQAKVLYHPCFAQPQVQNPVLRGRRPKTVVSLSALRDQREETARRNRIMALQAKGLIHSPESILAEWIQDVQDNIYRIETLVHLRRGGTLANIVRKAK